MKAPSAILALLLSASQTEAVNIQNYAAQKTVIHLNLIA
jgi:hypothetical protein